MQKDKEEKKSMPSQSIARVLYPAPHFEGIAWDCESGPKQVQLSDYRGSYLLLFFYPMDFTFVCPTEIREFSNHSPAFKSLGCEVLGCSGDTPLSHKEYTSKPRNRGGLGPVLIPLLADPVHKVAKAYGAYICSGSDAGAAFRATYIIDREGIVRHRSINDLPVGRNVEELLRLVKAFNYVDKNGGMCPANWKEGDKTVPVPEFALVQA
eukprot:TRINITY_DN110_c0_g2_i1.p2 TRINITY_DN110_c0_g2~~TRINITY_DN110_c0_g2_i1.p2  ORF type:complete len:209 (-),score=69.72 TRINITY_DN110_c0_g2_i1:1702-2328(-)